MFTVEPEDTNVTSTEDLMLTCSANAFPRPDIVWLHNDSVVEDDARIMITDSPSGVDITSVLMVMNTTFNDSGNYTCVARSPVFNDVMSREALVLIQGKSQSIYSCSGIYSY